MARNNVKHQLLPHAYWIIGILIAFNIIFLAIIFTCKIYNANSLISFISNASTLLSIALSVFAILYTFSSNIQIQQQFEKINNAANIIVSTSNKLDKTSSILENNIEYVKDHLQNIDRGQKEMTAQILDLNTQLGSSISSKIPQLNNNLNKTTIQNTKD